MADRREHEDAHALRDEDWFAPAPAEDDWFSDEDQPSGGQEQDEWFVPSEPPPPPRARPAGLEPGRRLALVIVVVAAGIGLLAAGVLLVRAFGGGDGETTATLPTNAPVTTTGTPTASEPATTESAATQPATTEASPIAVPQDVTLRRGDEGQNVEALQQALAQLGFDPGTIDANFGAATEQAVTAFQADAGLDQDGVAGPATLAALADALASG